MGYASSLLKRDTDVRVKALDAQAMDYTGRDLLSEIERFKPDLVVVEVPTVSFSLTMDLLREAKERVGCKIVVGGLHASGLPRETMENYPFLDYLLTGEYELALPDLLRAEGEGDDLRKVQGLLFRSGGKMHYTFPPSFNVDFDSLPYPDRDELPVECYHDMEVAGKPTVQMLTSRGCPHQCAFCCTTILWPKGAYWQRKAPNVVDEMEYVKETYGAKQVYFDDDIVSMKMLRDLAKEILSRGLDLPWIFMGSIYIDEDTLELVSKAGAIGLKFGVESINPVVLDSVNKKWIEQERVRKFVGLCKKYELWTLGTFIVGLPHDTRESILKTLQFAIDLDLNQAQFYIATPLPGGSFYKEAKEKGWLVAQDWIEFDGNYRSTLSYPWLPKEEIEELIKICKRRWEYSAFKKYARSPRRMFQYIRGRGLRYTLRKVKTLLTSKGHILTPGL
ncbi:MAG: B12-binding domain-containing radical SAM protein [Candidatus Geothermarchaeales archaeon]